jgi:serine/threonine protein kinase
VRICPQCRSKTNAQVCPSDGAKTVHFGQHIASQGDPFIGQVLQDRYRIDSVLGKGGFGAVYRGEQLAVGRTVAIKLLHAHHAEDAKEIARFQREARAIAALRHPNIVQVHDFGQTKEGFLYLVMEHLEGRTFKDITRDEAPLEPDRIIDYLVQVLDGLAEAHSRGVIHRDLKPENVFCATIGRRTDVIKLLDFGIAKLMDDSEGMQTLTGKGIALGSPRYMSPEQAKAQPISEQTDLYLVGLITYELLTGHSVFTKSSPTAYLLAHVQEPPPPLAVDGVELGGPLVDLVLQCLAKEPGDRPEGAEVLMAAMEACRGRGLDEVGVMTTTGADFSPKPLAAPEAAPPEQAPVLPVNSLQARAAPRSNKRRLTPTLKPPLPPTAPARPATRGQGAEGPSPLQVFVSVFLLVLLLGGGLVAFWISTERSAPPAPTTVNDQAAGESIPTVGSGSSTESREEPGERVDPAGCTTAGDCGGGQVCVDGLCDPET